MSELAADLLAALDGETEIVVRWPEDPEPDPGGRVIILTWDDEGGDGE